MNDIVFSYTRKEAIEDGVLIDVSTMAKEAGITSPVAVTVDLYEKYLNPSEKLTSHFGQSYSGRLWDTLSMCCLAAIRRNTALINFSVAFLMKENEEPQIVTLKAMAHGGDDGELVITIMLPHED